MKTGLVISFLLIAGLIVWNLILQKNISVIESGMKDMKDAITQLKSTVTSPVNTESTKRSVNGADLWKDIKDSLNEMKVDFKFNNE